MKDPTRLLSGEASELERELLGSWDAEQPSDEARAKVLAMTSLGAGAALAALGANAGTSLAPKASAAGGALVKWLLLGAIGAVAAGGSLAYVRHTRRESGPSAVSAPAAITASILAPLPVSAPVPGPVSSSVPVPTAADAPPARESSLRAASPPRHALHAKDDSLGEQVSSLDTARHTLASGDAPGALRQLDDYAARFPHPALVEEADALRIEALLAASDRAAASRAGARFLAAHPSSPLAPRVRALLGQGADR